MQTGIEESIIALENRSWNTPKVIECPHWMQAVGQKTQYTRLPCEHCSAPIGVRRDTILTAVLAGTYSAVCSFCFLSMREQEGSCVALRGRIEVPASIVSPTRSNIGMNLTDVLDQTEIEALEPRDQHPMRDGLRYCWKYPFSASDVLERANAQAERYRTIEEGIAEKLQTAIDELKGEQEEQEETCVSKYLPEGTSDTVVLFLDSGQSLADTSNQIQSKCNQSNKDSEETSKKKKKVNLLRVSAAKACRVAENYELWVKKLSLMPADHKIELNSWDLSFFNFLGDDEEAQNGGTTDGAQQ